MTNYRTLNRKLINSIIKAYDKGRGSDKRNALRVLKTAMQTYRKKMLNNAEKSLGTSKDFKYTIDSVERKMKKAINNGKLSTIDLQNELRRQTNRLITNSRKYQKQVQKLDKDKKVMKRSTNNTYIYVLTHPTKTGIHDPACLNRLANNPYTKQQALDAMNDLPAHINCTCHFIEKE